MNHSSMLCAGSCFFLGVVHLVRDSCPRRGHKCEDLDPPARKHSSEQLSAPWLGGLKAILIPRGRRGTYCCLCVHVHTPPKQTTSKLHVCDMKSWYSFLELLFLSEHRAWFPFGKSSLSGGCFFHPCVDIQTQRVTPGLVLILDRFYPRHFWLEYVRNWRVASERRSWGWQEGLKKDSICYRTASSFKWKTQVFFTGPITTLF